MLAFLRPFLLAISWLLAIAVFATTTAWHDIDSPSHAVIFALIWLAAGILASKSFAGANSVLSWLIRLKQDYAVLWPRSIDNSDGFRDTRWTRNTFLWPASLGIIALFLYALQWTPAGFARVFGGGVVLSVSSLLVGTCVGFLFGVPRTLQSDDAVAPVAGTPAQRRSSQLRVNTNLEQISDWLTKIIVGLGLAHLTRVPRYIDRLANTFKDTVGGDQGLAIALMLGYSICGFMLGYLLTRLYLTGALIRALTRAEQDEQEIERELQRVGAATASDPASSRPSADVDPISPEQKVSAAKVERLAGSADIGQLRGQVDAIAAEYESIRANRPSGPERTRLMEVCASKMRALSLACYELLPSLATSASPGHRLAAVSFLEVRPNDEYIEWLEERVEQEKPFIGYHATWALRHAAKLLSREYWPRIRRAIERGIAYCEGTSNVPSDRHATLKAALAELGQREHAVRQP